MDFKNYKFRCSGLHNLLVDPKNKKNLLSSTTKTYLKELWIKEMFGREKYITSKYMTKGTIVESDSLDLVNLATGETMFKNGKHYENEYIQGTPDHIGKDFITDIKSSWDIWTFSDVDESKARKTYYSQLLGYMWLCGKEKSRLIYCLTNTPDELTTYELYKLTVSGCIKDENTEQDKAKINFVFDDIDPKLRIKKYEFDFSEDLKNKLIERITLSRDYMNGLSL